MPKCKKCGFELEPDVTFCPNCGAKVEIAVPVAPAANAFTGSISGLATVVGSDASDSSNDLETGTEFAERYKIERKLGQGAMGVVYLAGDKLTSRQVAVKLINPNLVNSPSAQKRFIDEGLIARDIRHKNVVAVYDMSQAGGQFYLVMEYLSGQTLRAWLHAQTNKDIPYASAEKLIRNILEGVDAAHSAGVVHRDIKPENIMLTGNPDNGDFSLKILDFGIARAAAANARKNLTTTTTSTGSLLYMPPEQRTAADTVGPPADLYAVTAVFWELLLGVAPSGRWTPPSKERDDLPAGVDAIIDKGLRDRPQNRYQNAQDYLKALDNIRNAPIPSPLPTPEPTPPPRPPRPGPATDWRKYATKRNIIIVAGILFGFWLIGTLSEKDNPNGGGFSSNGPGPGPKTNPIPDVDDTIPKSLPSPTPPATSAKVPNIQDQWFDELSGTRIAQYRVVIKQAGAAITGSILDDAGTQWGTLSGRMNGNVLEYNYASPFGTGSGRGQLDRDGNHMQVLVNGVERHTLHRNHLPGQ